MTDDPLEAVLVHLRVRRRRADTAECICPAHEDGRASLTVSRGQDQPVVLRCHAGCSPDNVCRALGLSMRELCGGTEHVVSTYVYQASDGSPLYYVERRVPKSFRPRLLDGSYARPPAATEVLYNLPWVAHAKREGQVVYLVEGERDCEVARDFGLVATTAMSGASQPWLPQFTQALAGAHVVIVADNDDPGRARARRLLVELEPVTRSLRAVLPRIGKDLADHLWAGYSAELLDPLPAEGAVVRYPLSHVAHSTMTWAWSGWIPQAMLTLVEGDPGGGKSILTIDLAARWTTGAGMPDGSLNPFGGPIKVGLTSAEDDPGKIILPRLVVAGGNPANLVYVAGMPLGGRYLRNVDLERDVEMIREMIEDEHLNLFILDPLMAFLGSTRTAIDNEVRKVLTPLRYVAEETGCAILAVRHLRKAGGKAVHAGGGSIAFTGQARSVLLVGEDRRGQLEETQGPRRVLAQTKLNIGPKASSLAYEVTPADPSSEFGPGVVRWLGESDLDAGDLVAGLDGTFDRDVRAEVAEELVALLSIEELDYTALKKRLLLNGVEATDKTIRAVLGSVAVKVVHHNGTAARKITYRLKGLAPVPPVDNCPPDASSGSPLMALMADDDDSHLGHLEESGEQGQRTLPSRDQSYPQDEAGKEDKDLAVACTVCHLAGNDAGLIWYSDGGWRCQFHSPITYRGDEPPQEEP